MFHGERAPCSADVPRGTIPIDLSNSLEDLRRLLLQGLGEIPLTASDRQVELLLELSLLLQLWSGRFNLTGHRRAASILQRLLLDAAALMSVLPGFSMVSDLGSGAGFPGLPFAILRPHARVVLVESRERRHHFQRTAIRRLGLGNVEARRGRVEVLDPVPSPLTIAQALGPPRQALEWMVPWTEVGGLMVIPGGEEPPDPGADACVEEPRVLEYRLPLSGRRRTLGTARRRA